MPRRVRIGPHSESEFYALIAELEADEERPLRRRHTAASLDDLLHRVFMYAYVVGGQHVKDGKLLI